nr:TIGR00269 family protein [Candidatus Freyarchaeota archaeon]
MSNRAKRCSWCGELASVKLPYARLSLCSDHFLEYIERRVKNTIKRYKLIRPGDRVVLSLSGGKDSLALLHILHSLGDDFELCALGVDLGIKKDEYSARSIEVSERYCRELGVEFLKVDLEKDYGFTIDDVSSSRRIRRPVCSSCGVVKRYVTNRAAVELGADSLATGHNLDDESTVLLSNYLNADIDLLARSGPVLPSRGERMVSRIKPLYETSEWETSMYVYYRGIQPVEQKCPYALDTPISRMKEIVNLLEERRTGSKIALVRGFAKKIKPILAEHHSALGEIGQCEECGYPTSTSVCSFCRLRKRVLNSK